LVRTRWQVGPQWMRKRSFAPSLKFGNVHKGGGEKGGGEGSWGKGPQDAVRINTAQVTVGGGRKKEEIGRRFGRVTELEKEKGGGERGGAGHHNRGNETQLYAEVQTQGV